MKHIEKITSCCINNYKKNKKKITILPETKSSLAPENRLKAPKRKWIFEQPSIFRCKLAVSFRKGNIHHLETCLRHVFQHSSIRTLGFLLQLPCQAWRISAALRTSGSRVRLCPPQHTTPFRDLLLYEGSNPPTYVWLKILPCLSHFLDVVVKKFSAMYLSMSFLPTKSQQPKTHWWTRKLQGPTQQMKKKWKNQSEQTTRNNPDNDQSAVSCFGTIFLS